MSFDTRDEQSSMVICPNCDASHPPSYRLTGCGHPHCDTLGCHLCFFVCQVSMQCGHFCGEHVNDTDLGGALKTPIKACLRCEEEDLNDSEGTFIQAETPLELLRLMPDGVQPPDLLRFIELLQYPFIVAMPPKARAAKAKARGAGC